MKKLETNDWMVLNSIIYKIYTTKDVTQMRRGLLEQMKLVLDFDSADFYLTDTHGQFALTEAVTYNCDDERAITYDEVAYSQGILRGGKSLVYRETDLIPEESRIQSEYYQKVFVPNNWHHGIHLVVCWDKHLLGVITFYRSIGKDDFQYDDIFLLDTLKEHLAFRLEQSRKERGMDGAKMTIRAAVKEYELTRREETILRLLLAGLDNEAICEQLVISVNTLKKHVLNIYRKLGIRNRVQMFKMIREKE